MHAATKSILSVAAALTVLLVGAKTIYRVDETELGLVLQGGQAIGTASPGWHVKVPFYQTVYYTSTHVYRAEIKDLGAKTMSQQELLLRVSATYRIAPEQALERYRRIGTQITEDVYLKPLVYTVVKDEFARLSAQDAMRDREALGQRILGRIRSAVTEDNWPVQVEVFRIEHIDFTEQYQAWLDSAFSIEALTRALGSVDNLLAWQRIQKWNGVLPTTMVPAEMTSVLGLPPRMARPVPQD